VKRYFEFIGEDKSRKSESAAKFWEVSVSGSTMNVRFGKIGVNGQTTVKEFSSTDEATKAAEKLIAEKTKKGYIEK
jgi:predicted DNA-binding WGR domain protein